MSNEAHMKALVLRHGQRVRRLWFIGACITFCCGLAVAGAAVYRYKTADSKSSWEEPYRHFDRDNLKHALLGSAAVGLGFTAMLAGMGCMSYAIQKRFVNRSTCSPAQLKHASVDQLLSAGLGTGPATLLGFIAPVRTAAFTFKHDDKDVSCLGHLFGNEVPYHTDEQQCWALSFTCFGKPVAILVCEESKRPS